MYFSNFVIISPWKRGAFIWTNLNPLQGRFVPSLVEIGPVVLEKKMKMWKVYNKDAKDNDDRQRTNFDQKAIWVRWAKKVEVLERAKINGSGKSPSKILFWFALTTCMNNQITVNHKSTHLPAGLGVPNQAWGGGCYSWPSPGSYWTPPHEWVGPRAYRHTDNVKFTSVSKAFLLKRYTKTKYFTV